MVELSAVNRSVVGSSPTCGAIWPRGQAVKTPPFHGGNTGSSPVGVIQTEVKYRFCFFIWRVVRAGRRSTPGKCVGATSVSRVRIPHSPLITYFELSLNTVILVIIGFRCFFFIQTFIKICHLHIKVTLSLI